MVEEFSQVLTNTDWKALAPLIEKESTIYVNSALAFRPSRSVPLAHPSRSVLPPGTAAVGRGQGPRDLRQDAVHLPQGRRGAAERRQAIDHIGFSFADLDAKMKELEAAGVKVVTPVRDVPGLFKLGFIEDPWGVKLVAKGDATPSVGRAIDHVGWRVPDLDKILATLTAKNIKVLQGPTALTLATGVVHYSFVEDPSGTKIEIVQR